MTTGWELIVPFLRPVEPFLADPEVTDILLKGSGPTFVEKAGLMTEVPGVSIPERSLVVAIRNIARGLGDDVNEECPILDAHLPDGSRLAGVLAPCSLGGTTVAIRKFQNARYSAEELVRVGTLPTAVLALLQAAIHDHRNVLIAGGTGAGKTTLLNALTALIPADERLLIIEDTAEIQVHQPNVVRLEARREQPGLPAVTIRALLKASLRLRPDRILVGEVRGPEAFDLLQALNTGHAGTLATTHADSARLALSRFATCVMTAGVELPYSVVREQIGESLHLVVHLARKAGQRHVTEVVRVSGYDVRENRFELETLYARA